MFMDSRLLSGDEMSRSESHRNLEQGSCRRTQQRLVISPTLDEGFTQAWDTVGAGAYQPTSERAHLRGA